MYARAVREVGGSTPPAGTGGIFPRNNTFPIASCYGGTPASFCWQCPVTAATRALIR